MTTPATPARDPIAPRVKSGTKPNPPTVGKRTASVVPALPTDAKTRDDMRDKLAQWYGRFGKVASNLGRVTLGTALAEQSAPCADAWLKVAEKNANVRRFVFAVHDGNAWLDLVIAHAPVLLATLPESALDKLMNQFTSALFSASTDVPTDDKKESGNPDGT